GGLPATGEDDLQPGGREMGRAPARQTTVEIDGYAPLGVGRHPAAQAQDELGLVVGVGEADAGHFGDEVMPVDQEVHQSSRSRLAKLAASFLMPVPLKATVTSSSSPVTLLSTTMPSPKRAWRTFWPVRKV